ncbi:hypothetical protein [uncultured Maribacter sp.]|uniref:hypothetical protein n=1 Tax=uncultured Maribacter sp. TaxID=431308 RepID=UPI0026328634|nr:hypothetical protein [uncultured Maribacter sp.]
MERIIIIVFILLFAGCKNDNDEAVSQEIELCVIFKNESIIKLSNFQFKILDIEGNTLLLDRTDFDEKKSLKLVKQQPVFLELYIKDDCRDFSIKRELGLFVSNQTKEIVISNDDLGIKDSVEEKVYEGYLNISNQEELDAFGLQNYSKIVGDITISGVNNLCSLKYLKEVTGFFGIGEHSSPDGNVVYAYRNPDLHTLSGLENLSTVGGSLQVYFSSCINLNELSNLTSIGGGLSIYSNELLTNIDGLSKIEKVARLEIMSNNVLPDLNGLSNLETIYSDISTWTNGQGDIYESPSLMIFANASLKNVDGLAKIKFPINSLRIGKNDSLSNLNGLLNVPEIQARILIRENTLLTDFCGLKGVPKVDRYYVGGNGYNPTQEQLATDECKED